MPEKWLEGYSAFEQGIIMNPYCHWEGYPEHELSCEQWQTGWDAAEEDYSWTQEHG